MGTLQKLQNSIQTLISFWAVYPIHTNSLFWVIFVELPFCHFPPPNTSIRGKDSKIQFFFHLNILVFQTNGKQPHSFPVLSRFCNGLWGSSHSSRVEILVTKTAGYGYAFGSYYRPLAQFILPGRKKKIYDGLIDILIGNKTKSSQPYG